MLKSTIVGIKETGKQIGAAVKKEAPFIAEGAAFFSFIALLNESNNHEPLNPAFIGALVVSLITAIVKDPGFLVRNYLN